MSLGLFSFPEICWNVKTERFYELYIEYKKISINYFGLYLS